MRLRSLNSRPYLLSADLSLLLLAPPLAAAETYLLFGDRLTPVQLAGFAIALVGVFLCNPGQRAPAPTPSARAR